MYISHKKRMKKIKVYWNKIIAIVSSIILLFFAMQDTVMFTFAQTISSVESTKSIFRVSKKVLENGRVLDGVSIMQGVNDYKDGIIFQLENSDDVIFSTKSEGEEFVDSSIIYSENDYQMTASKNDFSGVLVAENDISISGQDNMLHDGILFSKEGDIYISGKNVEVTGFLYAPKGDIKFNCENVEISGCIISENVSINAANISYLENDEWNQEIQRLWEYKNSDIINITMYYNEAESKIGIEDVEAQKIKLYLRYGDEKFTLVDEYKNGQLFELPKENDYVEAYMEIIDSFGEKKLSDIETFQNEGEGCYSKVIRDTDNDGIPNGYEIREGIGDWNCVDTDADGLSDGESCLLYGLDIEMKETEMIQMSSNHSEKLQKKCGDVLRFVQDDKDSKVIGTYTGRIGDDVQVYYNEENEKVTFIYNVIQGTKRLEKTNNTYTMYFYDLEGQIDVKIAYDGENYIYNEYTYGNKGIDSIYHNDMHYSF